MSLAQLLEERARKVATKLDVAAARRVLGTFAVIALGERKLGLPVLALQEIVRAPSMTALPNLPAWFAGLALVRGELVAVLDFGRLYGLAELGSARFVAVLRAEAGALGVLVESVLGFRQIFVDEVQAGVADPAAHLGLPSLGTTRDLVTLLDAERLFGDARVVVDTESVPGTTVQRLRPNGASPPL